MRASTIVDTGPLVAALNKRDSHHEWAKVQLGLIAPPLLTCEAVLTETCFLLQSVAGGHEAVFRFLERSLLTIPFRLDAEIETVNKLLKRYENIPM